MVVGARTTITFFGHGVVTSARSTMTHGRQFLHLLHGQVHGHAKGAGKLETTLDR